MPVQSLEDLQVFSGVMDADTEKRRIEPGDYLMLRNARSAITNGQNFGAIEDAEGNLFVANTFLGYPGRYKKVGDFEDIAGQSIIYMVWNSEGFHGIFRWYFNRPGFPYGVIEKVWQVKDPSIYDEFNQNPLNFKEDELITGVNLVDNILLWVQKSNEPKQMDIVRANETNKRRKFNFYLNPNQLSENVPYQLSVVDEVSPLIPILPVQTFTSNKSVLTDRVEDITNQINALTGIGYTAVNKIYYIELQLESLFSNIITVGDPATSRILAENFYYYNVPGNYFNLIQAPPFCRPAAQYIPAGPPVNAAIVRAIYDTLAGEDTGSNDETINPPAQQKAWIFGIGSEQNDINNNIELGGTTVFQSNWNAATYPGLNYISVQGYIHTQNGSLTIKFQFHLECNFTGIIVKINPPGGPSNQFINVILPSTCDVHLRRISQSGAVTNIHSVSVPLVSNPVVFDYTSPPISVNALATDKIYLTLNGRGLQNINFNLAFADMGSVAIGNSTQTIIKQTNMFRNRYVFENFQKSVYGQATSVILRTEGYKEQFQVELSFNDKFISSDAYCSRLKEIILSYTKDGGKTWYDYDSLKPYQFVCQGTQKAIFDGRKQSIPVDPALAILQFHAIPLLAQSQEFVDDRLIPGGITEGYNSIDLDLVITYWANDYVNNTYYASGALPISVEGFKPGYSGYIGIVYYDDYDRKSAVCLAPNSKINIPYYPPPLTAGLPFNAVMPVWHVLIDVYNKPPDWATKYRLVRTKDFSQTNYLMWVIDAVEIINQDGTTGGAPKYWKLDLKNIPYYVEKSQRGAVIEYTYTVGDRVRLITNQAGDVFSTIYDFEIRSADGNNIFIDYDPLITITSGCLIEIYSKGGEASIEDSLFFEMGECLEIGTAFFDGILRKFHKGNNPVATAIDQAFTYPNGVNPAKLMTAHGGVYNRIRRMYYDTAEPVVVDKIYWINSNFADEYEQSKEDGLTRPNQVLRLGRISRPSSGRFSNRYLSGTEINGLNEFEPLNEFTFNVAYGLMSRMKVVNNDILKIIFSNSYQMSIYISQGVIRQLQTVDTLISVSDKVVENSHIIQRTLGTINPESVALNDEADLIGWDENEGEIWRASGNGLISISDNKQKRTFKNFSNLRRELDRARTQTPAVYDLYHDEYILTLGALGPAPEILPWADIDIANIIPVDGGLQFNVTIQLTNPTFTIITSGAVANGVTVLDYIGSIFETQGWTWRINPVNGHLLLFAPNVVDYNNREILITIATNQGETLGPELVRNGIFSSPNQLGDWQYDPAQWILNPGSPGNQFASHIPGVGTDPLYQENNGFQAGKTYRTIFSSAITPFTGNIAIALGSPPFVVVGIFRNLPGTDFTQDLPYADTASDKFSFICSQDFQGTVYNVSIREVIPGSTFQFRYKINNGVEAQTGTPFPAETIVYNKSKNGWTHYFDFAPEGYGRLNTNIVAFQSGQLWLFHKDAPAKNYFGIQYPRKFRFVVNKNFAAVKVFKALAIKGLGKNSAPFIVIPPFEGVPTGMQTELTLAHFSTKEGTQYAAIMRDKLDPRYSDPNIAWVNGRLMRGEIMEIELVNNDPAVSIISSVKILYFSSEIN